uniref:F5/8 type C domain-containing protein n=1 Tax=Knipowitschia caucasica TaxID=637954 RepID=A0AAV2LA31_KNICA
MGTREGAAVTLPAVTPTRGPKYQGICSSPLGLEDGRIHYGQLTSSTSRENNPADAGRLNIVPNVKVMEPGWSPLPSDPQPYFQVDLLEPTWVSGVVTQGSERMRGSLTKYRLAFSLNGKHYTDYTEDGKAGSPPQVFEVRLMGRSPVTRWLGRLLRARFLRILAVEFRHTFYLRAEIMGCTGEELVTPPSWTSAPPGGAAVTLQRCPTGQFSCRYSEDCVPVSVLCDGRPDCKDHSDEINCGTVPTGRPSGHRDNSSGSPGLHTTRTHGGQPGFQTTTPSSDWRTAHPGLHLSTRPSGEPGLHSTPAPWSTAPDAGQPRGVCVGGQVSCRSFGCVEPTQVCDGTQDCVDGSDEAHCGT